MLFCFKKLGVIDSTNVFDTLSLPLLEMLGAVPVLDAVGAVSNRVRLGDTTGLELLGSVGLIGRLVEGA